MNKVINPYKKEFLSIDTKILESGKKLNIYWIDRTINDLIKRSE